MRKLLVLLAAVAFVFAFTTPAAAEVNFSGYIAMQTYFLDVDNVAPTKDSSDLEWIADAVCSRLTARFKQGPVGGLVEIRPLSASYFRHWWGTWNFGAATLGIGQMWTPDFSCITGAKYGCGAMTPMDPGCTVRIPMIQLQMGGLKIAAAQPNAPAAHIYGTDWETSLPKLMVSYNLNAGMVGLKFFGGYQTIDDRNSTTDQSQSIDSMLYGLTAGAGFGQLNLKLMVYMADNFNAYGGSSAYNFTTDWDGTKMVDTSFMAYGLNLAYKVSDTLQITASYVTGTSESDTTGTWEDETNHYHVNATFTLAKGVTITPEYVVLDRSDFSNTATTTAEQAVDTRYGVYWQIAF